MANPLRIGMIGLDTSHVPAFTNLLNNADDPNHVPGGKVVIAYPGGSADFDASINRVEGFTKELRDKWGVKIVDTPEAVAEACDLLFIESVDGRVHLEQFRKTVKYGKPTYIDKPFAVCSSDANEIKRLADEADLPVMSASSIRYSEPLTESLQKSDSPVVAVDVFGPMAIQPTQPGLYWYGIHTVDALYRVMGVGCQQVQSDTNEQFDVVTATWADGRVCTVRGARIGHHQFGMVIHREDGAEYINLSASARPNYACMLDVVMACLPEGRTDIDLAETCEEIRMIEAANESRGTGDVVRL